MFHAVPLAFKFNLNLSRIPAEVYLSEVRLLTLFCEDSGLFWYSLLAVPSLPRGPAVPAPSAAHPASSRVLFLDSSAPPGCLRVQWPSAFRSFRTSWRLVEGPPHRGFPRAYLRCFCSFALLHTFLNHFVKFGFFKKVDHLFHSRKKEERHFGTS